MPEFRPAVFDTSCCGALHSTHVEWDECVVRGDTEAFDLIVTAYGYKGPTVRLSYQAVAKLIAAMTEWKQAQDAADEDYFDSALAGGPPADPDAPIWGG